MKRWAPGTKPVLLRCMGPGLLAVSVLADVTAQEGGGAALPGLLHEARAMASATLLLDAGGATREGRLELEGQLSLWCSLDPPPGAAPAGGGATVWIACLADISTIYSELVSIELAGTSQEFGDLSITENPVEPSLGLVERVRLGSVPGIPVGACVGEASYDLNLGVALSLLEGGKAFLANADPIRIGGHDVPLEPVGPYELGHQGDIPLQDTAGVQTAVLRDLVLRILPPDPVPFTPGDCNADGSFNISDALCVFGVLFLGQPSGFPCGRNPQYSTNRMLLDWQPDGQVNISDGIATLIYLFVGGTPHFLWGNDTPRCVPIHGCPERAPCQ